MKNYEEQERHILVINGGKGRQAIALDAAAYSIGRDLSNAIVLDFETVSRQHAILLRVPVPGTNRYRYQLVDGNADGKPSTNGTFINGQRCVSEPLRHGDTILFGRKIKAAYLIVSMAEHEFANYLESIAYQSIKSQTLSPKETLVGAEFSGELLAQQLNKATKEVELRPLATVAAVPEPPEITPAPLPTQMMPVVSANSPPVPAAKETVPETGSTPIPEQFIRHVVVGCVVVVAISAGIGFWLNVHQSRPDLPKSGPTQPS